MANSIGFNVQAPKKACQDDKCPYHGAIKVRGRQHTGTVVSTKMRRSAVVQWEHRHFIPKYERYERRLTKITVHAPDCLDVKEGDMVRIAETRPLSKTKNFTVIENLGQEKGYALKKEGKDESKVVKKEKKSEEDNEAS
jgi:small subunit ribosomal protein S17